MSSCKCPNPSCTCKLQIREDAMSRVGYSDFKLAFHTSKRILMLVELLTQQEHLETSNRPHGHSRPLDYCYELCPLPSSYPCSASPGHCGWYSTSRTGSALWNRHFLLLTSAWILLKTLQNMAMGLSTTFPGNKKYFPKVTSSHQQSDGVCAEVPPTPRGAHDWIKCKWSKLAGWLSCPGCRGIL